MVGHSGLGGRGGPVWGARPGPPPWLRSQAAPTPSPRGLLGRSPTLTASGDPGLTERLTAQAR